MEAVTQARSSARPGALRSLAGAAMLLASTLVLAEPACAQFGFSIGGFGRGGGHGGFRGGHGGGIRGGYGGGLIPSRPGGHLGGLRPPYGGGIRPHWPGHRPPVVGRPYPIPPWVVRPGHPVRPPSYRPPVVVEEDDPPPRRRHVRPRPPVIVHDDPPPRRRPVRPRPPVVVEDEPPPRARPRRPVRPVVVASPPAARPLKLKPFRPVVAKRPLVAPPVAPPPVVRRRPPATPPIAVADRTHVDREVLVEIAGAQPAGAIRRLAARNGLTLLGSTELSLAGTTVHRLRVNGRRSVDGVVDALGRDGSVVLAQRNHVYRLQVDGGQAYYPLASRQYAVGKLRLPEAHRAATGEGVTVAVIDSGIDADHPDLQGAIGGSENTLSSPARPDLHGTAIAGAIAARGQLLGVAPRTRIIAIRAFAPATARARAEGTSWDIVRAMELAAKGGARVVNLSFAGPADRLMEREIDGGVRRGMVFVAAAGNGGAAAPPAYPAATPGVIAVTATDLGDHLYASANRGSYVTVAAPGVDVLVASPKAGYDMSSGTSVAAAHVSGIVALMLQRDATLTPAAIRATLTARARDLGPAGPDPEFGAGLVDAHAALGLAAPVAARPDPVAPLPPELPPATVEPASPPEPSRRTEATPSGQPARTATASDEAGAP